ncbi:MAG: alcohol dehydrogenase catalytic domain-containing protein, partial [Acidobacteriaceae bacterium]|nr:alcohol dehydrogenase catalytic domain-containing protein [Acidobacteriaceae bacterium]
SIPDPGPGEVQVAVKAIGICGSDLHYFSEGGIGDARCVYPMVLGHEPAGVVTKTGPGVSGWTNGDQAVLEPAVYCYHCEYCMTGHHNVCSNLRFLSTPGEPGFFREFVNLPAHNVLPLPRNMSLLEGTLAEPFAIILHSMKLASFTAGETALVFGAGPIGALTVAGLKLAGASRVLCVEPLAHRRELAKAMGADAVLDPAQGDVVREVLRDTGQRGVDVTFDCASKDGTVNQSLLATRNAGRVVITGIPSEEYVELAFHALRRKELTFYSVRRSNRDSEMALRFLSDQLQRFAPVLTHSQSMTDIQPVFERCARYEEGIGKFVLTL